MKEVDNFRISRVYWAGVKDPVDSFLYRLNVFPRSRSITAGRDRMGDRRRPSENPERFPETAVVQRPKWACIIVNINAQEGSAVNVQLEKRLSDRCSLLSSRTSVRLSFNRVPRKGQVRRS